MSIASNTSIFAYDSTERAMRYITQRHEFQTWQSNAQGSTAIRTSMGDINQHVSLMTMYGLSVGIGTTQLFSRLDVNGNVRVVGNIGIGTTLPTRTLTVVGDVMLTGQWISSLATGTAPMSISSSTIVTNLNADLLDGQQGSYYQNASNINAGTLAVTYGGTGCNILTSSKLLVGNGTAPVTVPTDLHWTGANLGIGSMSPGVKLDVTGSIKASSQLISSVVTGTAPLSVASTTLVSNLNADLLDSQDGSYYRNATNINTGTLAVNYGGTGANTLTANKVLVGNGTTTVIQPTNLHWDNSNLRLGIGVTTPRAPLHVQGMVKIEGSATSAPDMNYVSTYQPNNVLAWWKIGTLAIANGSMMEISGNVSRVDTNDTIYFNMGCDTSGNVRAYSEISRDHIGNTCGIELYRNTTSNQVDVYLYTVSYCWATLRISTHIDINDVVWDVAPSTSVTYYKIYDTITTSNIAMVKTYNNTIGFKTQPRTGYTVDVSGNVGAGEFIGGGSGLTGLSMTNVGFGTLSPLYGGTGSNALSTNKLMVGNGLLLLPAQPLDLV